MATVKTEVEIDVSASCETCGNDLLIYKIKNDVDLYIEPCMYCLHGEYTRGYEYARDEHE